VEQPPVTSSQGFNHNTIPRDYHMAMFMGCKPYRTSLELVVLKGFLLPITFMIGWWLCKILFPTHLWHCQMVSLKILIALLLC